MRAQGVTGPSSSKESYAFHSLVEGINFRLLQYEGPTYFHTGIWAQKHRPILPQRVVYSKLLLDANKSETCLPVIQAAHWVQHLVKKNTCFAVFD